MVIDSLASLVPSEEGEKAMQDLQVALGARINGKFFRKSRKAGKRSLVIEDRLFLGLLINQPRVDVGGWAPHGRTAMTTPGGRAKNFAAFTRLELRRDEWIELGSGRGAKKIGQTIKARVKKNKSGPPERVAEWDFYFVDHEDVPAGQIDRVKDIFVSGVETGVLSRKGAYYSYGGQKWQGRAKTFQALVDDEDLAGSVEDDIRDLILGQQGRKRA